MIISAICAVALGLAAKYCGWLPNNPFDAFVAGVTVMMTIALWLRSTP